MDEAVVKTFQRIASLTDKEMRESKTAKTQLFLLATTRGWGYPKRSRGEGLGVLGSVALSQRGRGSVRRQAEFSDGGEKRHSRDGLWHGRGRGGDDPGRVV